MMAEACGEKFSLEDYCRNIFEQMIRQLDQLLERETQK